MSTWRVEDIHNRKLHLSLCPTCLHHRREYYAGLEGGLYQYCCHPERDYCKAHNHGYWEKNRDFNIPKLIDDFIKQEEMEL